jgi:hypothetical protein
MRKRVLDDRPGERKGLGGIWTMDEPGEVLLKRGQYFTMLKSLNYVIMKPICVKTLISSACFAYVVQN